MFEVTKDNMVQFFRRQTKPKSFTSEDRLPDVLDSIVRNVRHILKKNQGSINIGTLGALMSSDMRKVSQTFESFKKFLEVKLKKVFFS